MLCVVRLGPAVLEAGALFRKATGRMRAFASMLF